MKIKLIIICLILSLSLLFGCGNSNNGSNNGNNNNNDNNVSTAALKIQDYFPIQENVRYVYEGVGNEYASYDVTVEFTSDNKVQQRIDNGGTVTARVIEIKDGKLTRLLSRGEQYNSENLLDQVDEEEVLLMEPLEKGTEIISSLSKIEKNPAK